MQAAEPPAASPMVPRPFRIERVRREIPGVFTWSLAPDDGGAPLGFAPGQFNMLYMHGIGEVPISISGDGSGYGRLLHTIRAAGGVTRAMRDLKADGVIGVRGPFGRGWPVEEAEGNDVVFIAGGLGLAPLRPAIEHVLQHRDRYGNVVIYYGARSPREILYRREVERWRGRFDTTVVVTVDAADRDWGGRVGVVPRLVATRHFDPDATVAMTCGPEVMMRYAINALLDAGIDRERVYLSMERNMQCAIGLCGHCQLGGQFVCKDGPVFDYARIAPLFLQREL